MIDWIKITETTKPEFDEMVLLLEKGSKENKIDVGKLTAITRDGLVFKHGTDPLDFGNFFNQFGKSSFRPTHFARINLPKD